MRSNSVMSDAEMRSRSPSPGAGKKDHAGENGTGKGNSRIIVISNLSKNIAEVHLRHIFSNYGDIRKLDLPLHQKCESSYQR
jgi:RNA recognition motif-containing protein